MKKKAHRNRFLYNLTFIIRYIYADDECDLIKLIVKAYRDKLKRIKA